MKESFKGYYIRPNGEKLPFFNVRSKNKVKQVQVDNGRWINIQKDSSFIIDKKEIEKLNKPKPVKLHPLLTRKLQWSSGPGGIMLTLPSFWACVSPVLEATKNGVIWKTNVSVGGKYCGELSGSYLGGITEKGAAMAETYIIMSAIGIPHLEKEIKDMQKAKKRDQND